MTTPKRSAKRQRPSNATIGTGLFAVGMALAGFLARRQIAAWAQLATGTAEGHVPDDLLGDARPAPEDRAPAAFRPDMTAPMTAAEREALRPATLSTPTLQ